MAGTFGGGVAKRLSSGGFNDPSAQSSQANNLLRDQLHTGDPNVVLLVAARSGATVDSPAVAGTDDQVAKEIKSLARRYEQGGATIDVKVGGQAEVFHQVGTQVQEDL